MSNQISLRADGGRPMDISKLDSEKLYYSFVSGAQEVIKNKNNLNEINVFPVADGDTGSNLS